MSLTVNSMIMKVVVPIMFAAMILIGLQSIKVESLDPSVNDAQDVIGSFGATNIVIGDKQGDNYEEGWAEEEFREMVVFNMLTASNCRFIPDVEEDLEETDSYSQTLQNDNSKFMFDNFDSLRERTDTSFVCAGATNRDISDLDLPDLIDGKFGQQQGHDMEGNYGKINFEMNRTVLIEDPRLIAANFETAIKTPAFWDGEKLTRFIIPGLGNGCAPEKYNAYRVRMNQVPLVKEGYTPPNSELKLCNGEERLKIFMFGTEFSNPERSGAAKYVLCGGAKGFVRSNAGSDMEDTGEATHDNPKPEDMVFPMVKLTENQSGCIENTELYNINDVATRLDLDLTDQRRGQDYCELAGSVDNLQFNKEFEGRKVSEKSMTLSDSKSVNVRCGYSDERINHNWGGFSFYNTKIKITDDQCPAEPETYDIKNLYRETGDAEGDTGIEERNGNPVLIHNDGSTGSNNPIINWSIGRYSNFEFKANLRWEGGGNKPGQIKVYMDGEEKGTIDVQTNKIVTTAKEHDYRNVDNRFDASDDSPGRFEISFDGEFLHLNGVDYNNGNIGFEPNIGKPKTISFKLRDEGGAENRVYVTSATVEGEPAGC